MVTWLRSPFRWRVSTLAGSWGRATRPSRRDPGEDGGRQGRPHGRSDGMFAVPYFIGPKVYQSLWGSITGEWSIMILWFAEWQVLFGGKTGNVSLFHVARSILYNYSVWFSRHKMGSPFWSLDATLWLLRRSGEAAMAGHCAEDRASSCEAERGKWLERNLTRLV